MFGCCGKPGLDEEGRMILYAIYGCVYLLVWRDARQTQCIERIYASRLLLVIVVVVTQAAERPSVFYVITGGDGEHLHGLWEGHTLQTSHGLATN